MNATTLDFRILFIFLSLALVPQHAFGFGQVIGWANGGNVPASATNCVAIAAGQNFHGSHVALTQDGRVVSWNSSAQVTTPSGLSNVMEVAAGWYSGSGHAIKTNGTVVGWGSTHAALATLTNVVSIEQDELGVACLLADGSVARANFNGITNPPSLTNIVAIYPFNYGYIALRADGTLFVDSQGWMGTSPSPSNVMVLAPGGYRAAQGMILRNDRSLLGWGNPTNAPPSGTNFLDVAATQYGKFYLRIDGTVGGFSWAFSPDATTNFPDGLTNIISISGGEGSMIALRMTNRPFSPVTLSTALDTPALLVSSKGSSQWFGQTNVTHDGAHAARSGAIGHGTASSMRLWTNGPVQVSFWWKTSSETNKDVLTFSASGVVLTNISGESGWKQCTVVTPPGPQLLQWTYARNNSGSAGQDAAWVDQIVIAPPAAAPSLTVGRTNNVVVFSWPDTASSFELEHSGNLSITNWMAVPFNRATNNGQISIVVPISVGNRFFRLKNP